MIIYDDFSDDCIDDTYIDIKGLLDTIEEYDKYRTMEKDEYMD